MSATKYPAVGDLVVRYPGVAFTVVKVNHHEVVIRGVHESVEHTYERPFFSGSPTVSRFVWCTEKSVWFDPDLEPEDIDKVLG